ncbi:DUF488 domain-containing protein [Pseudonocardia yuanmonensis]|uniref:DUF488 domain-containing protein n=1 Tax=Pseudonocardia yuanmonensis TaxID=1095914 RepID=A0ABP8XKK3_9PSEU
MSGSTLRVSRVYDHEPHPGSRSYLVDRVWPRGVRRDDLEPAGWAKDVAPSPELRKWFGHDPERWEEFRRRYFAELDARPQAWRPLLEAARSGPVTLLYGSRDRDHNNAVALRDYLAARLVED